MSMTYELVRDRAALLDFSAEGRFFVKGDGSIDAVNAVIAADLEATPELKALNTVILADTGAIEAIVWVLKDEYGIWVICDADRCETVEEHLAASIKEHAAELENRTGNTFCLGIVGPRAQAIAMEAAGEDIIGISYLGFEPNEQTGSLLCRLGYSGEYEYRFIAPVPHAAEVRQMLLDAGQAEGLEEGDVGDLALPMLEMRSLSQRDHIPDETTPIQAGLHWMVDFRKEAFRGHDVVHAQKSNPGRKALMLVLDTDNPPDGESPVHIEQQEVGRCAYAAFSPTLGKTIALAYIDADLAWVGIVFDVAGFDALAVSAPLFITKTVLDAQ